LPIDADETAAPNAMLFSCVCDINTHIARLAFCAQHNLALLALMA
jgi:hypothetical protein